MIFSKAVLFFLARIGAHVTTYANTILRIVGNIFFIALCVPNNVTGLRFCLLGCVCRMLLLFTLCRIVVYTVYYDVMLVTSVDVYARVVAVSVVCSSDVLKSAFKKNSHLI